MEPLKTTITDYWSQRVEQFSALRFQELQDEKHLLWLKELEQRLPNKSPLKILDIGTGTGFFAFLLAARGHNVTGIDLTPEMIQEAKRVSGLLGISAEFFVMDGENPTFPAGSFDVIVTRNLTWNLPHLAGAYAKWHELLKPGGVLVNFDADYCRESDAVPLPANHAHKGISAGLMQEYQHMKAVLRPTQQPRPKWDVELLRSAGFHGISIDREIWRRIYRKMDQFYNPTPIFAITAYA